MLLFFASIYRYSFNHWFNTKILQFYNVLLTLIEFAINDFPEPGRPLGFIIILVGLFSRPDGLSKLSTDNDKPKTIIKIQIILEY